MSEIAQHPFLKLLKSGSGIGLHRVRYLMEYFGIRAEEVSRKSLVVTGSNGKGSTARIASELLKSFGLKTGLFTSPHLYHYNERFQINGIPVDDEALHAGMTDIMAAVTAYEKKYPDKFGAFEAQCALAIKWFSECNADCMVLEAGIGGRYDPVRIARSRVAGLVSLDLEHTELLGETLQEIALDKMDACFEGGSLVCGESCHKVRTEIECYAWLKALEVTFLNDANWKLSGVADGWQQFDIHAGGVELKALKSRLVGRHQLNNHAVAIELCHALLKRQGKWSGDLARDQWPQAIERVCWPGRLEKVCDSPPVYIDVGHTPDGIAAALEGFRSLTSGQAAILVTGGSYNKKVDEIVRLLAPSFGTIICTSAYHKGSDALEVCKHVKQSNPGAVVFVEATIESAVERAVAEAEKHGLNVYVAGGLFLAVEFAYTLRGGNARKLSFF